MRGFGRQAERQCFRRSWFMRSESNGLNSLVQPRKTELLGLIGYQKSKNYATLTGEMAEWSKATVC
ncbi:MAG TPA: hypothetical protein DIV79_12580 [Opitutae bacterium]|nr:hypothetical protein [Opitutaceae bacterium]HCR30842.1 hypothetical protein [Opitutae bacterium]